MTPAEGPPTPPTPPTPPRPAAPPSAPVRTPRQRLVGAVRIGLLVLVLVAVAIALVRNWREVSDDLGRISATTLVLALVLALVSPPLTMLGWRVLLADLGTDLHLAPAAGVFFVGQLGKYLPGSIWSVVAQAEMGARLGIPRRRSGVVGLVAMAMSLITAAVLGLPAVPLLLSDDRTSGSLVLGGVAAVLVVVALWPRVLNRGIALLLRVLRREPIEHELTGRAILATAVLFLLAWVFTGLSVWVLARGLAAGGASFGDVLLVGVCGFSLAAAIGMVSFLVPAGVGVREGLLVLVLVGVMTVPAATAVVVLARFLTVVSDVLWSLTGWLWARAHHLLGDSADGRAPRIGP